MPGAAARRKRRARAVLIDPEQAAKTAPMVGRPMAGWRAFQPLYDSIVATQPDFLEE